MMWICATPFSILFTVIKIGDIRSMYSMGLKTKTHQRIQYKYLQSSFKLALLCLAYKSDSSVSTIETIPGFNLPMSMIVIRIVSCKGYQCKQAYSITDESRKASNFVKENDSKTFLPPQFFEEHGQLMHNAFYREKVLCTSHDLWSR